MRAPRPFVLLLAVLLAGLYLLFAPGELSDQGAWDEPGLASSSSGSSAASSAVDTARPRQAAPRPAADAEPGFRDRRKLDDHYQRHGSDFRSKSAAEYDAAACALRDAPLGAGVLELERADGVLCRFRRADGAFLAFKPDGTVLTFFKPERGESYFRDQSTRAGR